MEVKKTIGRTMTMIITSGLDTPEHHLLRSIRMDGTFAMKLALSFVVGSVWITLVTITAERNGTKVGGFIAGLPSTIVIALFFIGWSYSTCAVVEATTVVPIIGGINCLFIVTYIVFLRVNFWLALFCALAVWFILSYGFVRTGFDNYGLSIGVYVGLVAISYVIADRVLGVESESGRPIVYTPAILAVRGLFSGFVIAVAVAMTKAGGPLLGGMFAMFPAVFVATLAITFFSHGPLFSAALMKSSILGAVGVVTYGVAVRYTYVPFGLFWGTVVSMTVSFAGSFLIHRFVAVRMT
ncbi:MAG: hypothetical protein A4E62_01693 [Syntrophorhabdus sp. PtaU1.Bin002]|nr:MAG: hypothetical protein A4E62_01693 [Syntrophorhabdus sp. PtaU1.Bin002]